MLPLLIAVTSLLATAAALIGVGQATRAIREEIIQVIEPARNQLYELQRLLALDEAEQRGGAPPPVLRRDLPSPPSIRDQQAQVLDSLRTLVRSLEPEAVEGTAELRAHVQRWQTERKEEDATPGTLRTPSRTTYVAALNASDRLHDIMSRTSAERRERVQRLERLESALIAGMILLAFASVLTLARIGQRQAALADQARRTAEEAERRRRDVERIAREKAQFIRGITHDLKNPLGAVDAYAQLLEAEINGSLSETERHYVRRIRSAVQQVLATIHDLLELARAESGQLRVERRATNLAELVTDITEDYRAAFEAAGLRLDVEAGADLPRVSTDERRVREILGNLLSNALKYTPGEGRVWVRTEIHLDGPGGGGGWVGVAVQDTGPGVAPEDQERIFEEFHRLESGSPEGGAGLGLAISRKMARLIGGDLTVRSRPPEGATFTLRLPLRARDPMGLPQRTPGE